jgi:transcriptional regulator
LSNASIGSTPGPAFEYYPTKLKAIVGVEIEIEEIQCKYKLSQNRPAADHQGVIDNLDKQGSATLVKAMCKALS